MVEKIITLENISLTDFLGIENSNINEVASAFPKSKIVSRGNEIRINGDSREIIKISDILNALLTHYQKRWVHTDIALFNTSSNDGSVTRLP